MTANRFLRLAAVGFGCLIVGACSGSGNSTPAPTGPARSSSVAASSAEASTSLAPAPGEALVRSMVGSDTDHFGWVRAKAKNILATYYPPGSHNYIGGQAVAPTDEILAIKMHGAFDHSAPPGAKSSASLALIFYNATTGKRIPFVQMWDGDAPDLGVGPDPGITDREQAAKRWDLRLVGTPTVRTP
jgi:hypothetical protein